MDPSFISILESNIFPQKTRTKKVSQFKKNLKIFLERKNIGKIKSKFKIQGFFFAKCSFFLQNKVFS